MRLLLFSLLACTAAAQNAGVFKDWKPEASGISPQSSCAGLRGLTGYEFTVASAQTIPATADAPEHCRVSGLIPPQVAFEVNLPASWNRRMYMFGNGGYAGEPFDAPGRIANRARALRQGFAVAATDTGHSALTEPEATFAVNPQKRLDWAFRSLHVTALTAKKLIAAYYASEPARSYFDGCSTGGRQGLILAQRFPHDFDGIVVGAPVLDFTTSIISFTWISQALAAAPIPHAKLKLLADKIYAQCDAVDGLEDGLIDDPRRCAPDPTRDLPRCAEAVDNAGCFTTAQINALEKIYSGVPSQGKPIFPGWPVSAEVAGDNGRSGWDRWIVSDTDPSLGKGFAQAFWRCVAFPQKDPAYDVSRFDFDRDPSRLDEIRQILDATDPNLAAFQQRGGKIVMYFGWADPALNARMGIDYFQQVQRKMGPATTDFMRLFMVPGMFHCGGGVGASAFDAMTPLVEWVEKSNAPTQIPAARISAGKVVRTRPLCPYPQVARYKGNGSIDEAQNFACAAPQ